MERKKKQLKWLESVREEEDHHMQALTQDMSNKGSWLNKAMKGLVWMQGQVIMYKVVSVLQLARWI